MADTSQRQRVVVTGIGVVSPLGQGIDNFWQNITAGQCGIAPITAFQPGCLLTMDQVPPFG